MALRSRVARARQPASREECRDRALRLLSVKSRSREELRRALEIRGYAQDVIGETLSALSRDGSLNEQAALESYLLNREERFSRERLRREMRQKGFPKISIDRALAAISDDDERALLGSLYRRRAEELASLAPEKRKKKVFDFLRRRGFPVAMILEAMGEIDE
jgi:regulatory protein